MFNARMSVRDMNVRKKCTMINGWSPIVCDRSTVEKKNMTHPVQL